MWFKAEEPLACGTIVKVVDQEGLDDLLYPGLNKTEAHWAERACKPFLGREMVVIECRSLDGVGAWGSGRYKYVCELLNRHEDDKSVAWLFSSAFFSKAFTVDSTFSPCKEEEVAELF